jgi:hypothetical protein
MRYEAPEWLRNSYRADRDPTEYLRGGGTQHLEGVGFSVDLKARLCDEHDCRKECSDCKCRKMAPPPPKEPLINWNDEGLPTEEEVPWPETTSFETPDTLGGTFPWDSGLYLRYDLIPMDVLQEIVEVFTFGQHKHVDNGLGEGKSWTTGVPYSHRVNKILRHLMAFVNGVDIDSESGRHVLAHLIVQAMLLLGMAMREGYEEEDDRARLNGARRE